MIRRPASSPSIIRRLMLGFAIVLALISVAGGLALWGMQSSIRDLKRAEQSYQQLQITRTIEAAFSRYLLAELERRLEGGGDPGESVEAGALRGALLAYRRQIGEEILLSTSETERARERGEMIRAAALSDLFETIEQESRLDRTRGGIFDTTDAARHFLDTIAVGREQAFLAVIFEVLEDERQEAEAAFTALDRTRDRLILAGAVLAGLMILSILLFFGLFQRGLRRPIKSLAQVAETFGAGQMTIRAPTGLPGEFAGLGQQFNQMADRIASEQTRLQAQVAERTYALETANDELKSIDAARRRFFANISHELRTPVTVLLGEAQIAARASGEEVLRDALGRIAASGGFLRRRLDDLMRLARSEDGQLSLTMGTVDLGDVVRSAANTAEGYAKANEITLISTGPAHLAITGDGEALRQALLALIDNAVKFSPPGGEVTLTLADQADTALITVRDTGPGFTGDPSQLFDRYAQESTGREAGGTGLGLSIAKWIVDQHHGTIGVGNDPAGGAVFRIDLPKGASPDD